jgi:hypothetical protein
MPTNYKADKYIRIKWPGHGITTQEVGVKFMTHKDGVLVAVGKLEWQKMLPPLLVKRGEQWYFTDYPVEVEIITKGRNAR